ncbi:hypothetical protein RJ639_003177 [Escallonia herrerae]|uniref:Protein kinase domain-containing protein n=1 Tax=Escallonia herrerae TaxID=1293975 RepID=A0AA88WA21_9ASTE|nr:hypothetical protein RJ639_003177 [Escallonia herrerae]
MESLLQIFITFSAYPLHVLKFSMQKGADGLCISGKNKDKWKFQSKGLMLFLQLLFCVMIIRPVSSQDGWDGVIVTQADYQALQAFKHELTDPKGFLKSWNDSGYGACSGGWTGIKCAQGQVIVIQLPWKGLGGRITEKMGQFQALRKLSLHDNAIGGPIPVALGFLPNLRGVQLFSNRLSGSIPPSLGSCPLLQTLDIGNNSLTGLIPDSLANLTKLYRLNLSFNSLSGSIPDSLTRLSPLIFLALEHNNLSGPIPDDIGKLSRLTTLDVSYNAINGSLPLGLSKLEKLSILNLRDNQISGNIPITIGNISSLRQIDLAHNSFSGGIPASLGDLPNLESFNVSYNNLSGPVPVHLSQKFNSSSFVGNLQLCGYSSSTPCPISPSVNPAPLPGGTSKGRRRKLSAKDIILIAAGALLVVLVVLCCILLCCLIRRKAASKEKDGQAAARGGEKGVPPAGGDIETARGPDTPIDWPTRMKIAKGMTRGLFYLHTNENIIHGNLTSSNVLLDEHTNAKIADFGLSRLMTAAANSNVIATAGALGYRAPELSKLKKASTKTDVYSLGVIILELLTGKSPGEANGVDLPQWVASIVKEEWTNEVFDLELMKHATTIGDELLNTLKLALHCVDPSPSARPEVQQVLQQLEEIRPETATSSGDDGAAVPSASD